jgi:hypothetical protein
MDHPVIAVYDANVLYPANQGAARRATLSVIAVYDANVLYPAPLRDLLIRLASRTCQDW